MRIVTLALLVLFIGPAWASEPGQPLDCGDWVFLKPGLRCVEEIPRDCRFTTECEIGPHITAVDNEGNTLLLRRFDIPICNGGDTGSRVEIIASRNGTREVIAYMEARCGIPGTDNQDHVFTRDLACSTCEQYTTFPIFQFDNTNGRLLLPLDSKCQGSDSPFRDGFGDYDDVEGRWLAAIEGFPSLFDINQSYVPTTAFLAYTVPYMPEGFQYADYFDTYYGDIATVGDWSQAQPLQCGYPATAPSVGEYLTVEDTLPTPAPGRGYYYVTAVNYQGQRRYGRQSNGGVLSGRDPAVLPVCE